MNPTELAAVIAAWRRDGTPPPWRVEKMLDVAESQPFVIMVNGVCDKVCRAFYRALEGSPGAAEVARRDADFGLLAAAPALVDEIDRLRRLLVFAGVNPDATLPVSG